MVEFGCKCGKEEKAVGAGDVSKALDPLREEVTSLRAQLEKMQKTLVLAGRPVLKSEAPVQDNLATLNVEAVAAEIAKSAGTDVGTVRRALGGALALEATKRAMSPNGG
jgi:hypothetical protein